MGAQLGKQHSVLSKSRVFSSRAEFPHAYLVFGAHDDPHDPRQGRVEVELFQKAAPRTVKRFLELVEGGDGLPCYKGASVDRIIPGVLIQGGALGDDVDGFPKERIRPIKHDEQFLLSTANLGTQFFFTMTKGSILEWDREEHVVFGRVVDGFEVLAEIEKFGTATAAGVTEIKCFIDECGRCVDEVAGEPPVAEEHKDGAEDGEDEDGEDEDDAKVYDTSGL